MTDRLGYRLKIGIVIPSTNTTVQPETDSMRPVGVTNHIGRIHIPDLPLSNDTEFEAMVEAIGPDLFQCVDRVMTCKPAHLIMAMSIPTFWGGKAGSEKLLARLQDRAGVPVTMGSDACIQALKRFEDVQKIGILTPYQPIGDAHVARYFEDHGYAVAQGSQPQAAERSADRARDRSRHSRRIESARCIGRRCHRAGRHRSRRYRYRR